MNFLELAAAGDWMAWIAGMAWMAWIAGIAQLAQMAGIAWIALLMTFVLHSADVVLKENTINL